MNADPTLGGLFIWLAAALVAAVTVASFRDAGSQPRQEHRYVRHTEDQEQIRHREDD
ncbi:MAG: hypothetical protein ACM3QS_01670 [Bacteroidota bacterium]